MENNLLNINETILSAATSAPKDFKKAQNEITAASDNKKIMEAIENYKMSHTPKIREHKIGRNDLCPCGSGLKYKNCCLKTGNYEKYIVKK